MWEYYDYDKWVAQRFLKDTEYFLQAFIPKKEMEELHQSMKMVASLQDGSARRTMTACVRMMGEKVKRDETH